MEEERRFQSTTGSPPPPPPTRFFREFKSSSRMTPIFSPSNSPRDGQTLSHTAQPFSLVTSSLRLGCDEQSSRDVQWRTSGPQSPPALAELRAKTQLDRMRMIAASYGPTVSPEGSPPDSQQTMMRAMERDRIKRLVDFSFSKTRPAAVVASARCHFWRRCKPAQP